MSVLYLIRHGQASFGSENYDRLSPMGRQQAFILGEHLFEALVVPDAVYSGSMVRQKDTEKEVRACYRKHGRVLPEAAVLSGLDEFDSSAVILSQLPGMQAEDPSIQEHLPRMYESRESFKRVFEGAMLRWVSGRFDNGRVQTWSDFCARVAGSLKRIMEEQGRGKVILAFTSGGPIAAAMQHVLSLSPEAAIRLNWQVINASYTKFMYNDKRITLAGFNCSSHLDLHADRLRLVSYR
jgi:broad specificity phosphatase PhoE